MSGNHLSDVLSGLRSEAFALTRVKQAFVSREGSLSDKYTFSGGEYYIKRNEDGARLIVRTGDGGTQEGSVADMYEHLNKRVMQTLNQYEKVVSGEIEKSTLYQEYVAEGQRKLEDRLKALNIDLSTASQRTAHFRTLINLTDRLVDKKEVLTLVHNVSALYRLGQSINLPSWSRLVKYTYYSAWATGLFIGALVGYFIIALSITNMNDLNVRKNFLECQEQHSTTECLRRYDIPIRE